MIGTWRMMLQQWCGPMMVLRQWWFRSQRRWDGCGYETISFKHGMVWRWCDGYCGPSSNDDDSSLPQDGGSGFDMDSCDDLPGCLLLVVWFFITRLMMDEEWSEMLWFGPAVVWSQWSANYGCGQPRRWDAMMVGDVMASSSHGSWPPYDRSTDGIDLMCILMWQQDVLPHGYGEEWSDLWCGLNCKMMTGDGFVQITIVEGWSGEDGEGWHMMMDDIWWMVTDDIWWLDSLVPNLLDVEGPPDDCYPSFPVCLKPKYQINTSTHTWPKSNLLFLCCNFLPPLNFFLTFLEINVKKNTFCFFFQLSCQGLRPSLAPVLSLPVSAFCSSFTITSWVKKFLGVVLYLSYVDWWSALILL